MQALGPKGCGVLVQKYDPALIWFFQKPQEPQQAGLARAVGTDDRVNQAGGEGMADLAQNRMALTLVTDLVDG
jgi:hypothetical protein